MFQCLIYDLRRQEHGVSGQNHYAMVVTLCAFAVLGAGAPIDVAFIARFYYPPPDNRISRQHVYLSDLHGGKRRRITSDRASARSSLEWVGKNAISWVDHYDDQHVLRLMELSDSKIRTIRKAFGPDTISLLYEIPALFPPDDYPVYAIGKKHYILKETGLTELGNPHPSSPYRVSETSWKFPGQPEIRYVGYGEGKQRMVELSGGTRYSASTVLFRRGGREYAFDLFGGWTEFYPAESDRYAWLWTFEPGSSVGSHEYLGKVDWQKGTMSLYVDDVISLTVRQDSRYWAGLQGGRPISPYGPDKRVWTHEIYVGDLRTRKQWTIAAGLVLGRDVSLRPGL